MKREEKNDKSIYVPARVLGIHPHGDDIEANALGIFYKWISCGTQIRIINTTISKVKGLLEWEKKVAEEFGYEVILWENYHPGGQQYADRDLTLYLCREIRKFKPDIVIAMPPFEQHPDHIMCYAATFKAVLMARCPFETEFKSEMVDLEEPGVEEILKETQPHWVKEIWIQPGAPTQNLWRVTPNYYVDITDIWEKRISVFYKFTEIVDLRTLADLVEYRCIKNGEEIGVKYAEAFLRIPIKKKIEIAKEYNEWRKRNKGKSYLEK